MLTRVLLALEGAALRKRIRNFLQDDRDIALVTVRAKRPVWERCICEPVDVLVVGRDILSNDAEPKLAQAGTLPVPPRIVVLSPEENAEDRARLLAAGCAAVLDVSLDDKLLRASLRAVVRRGAGEPTDELTARKRLEEPRLADFVSESESMRRFLEVVRRVVASDTTLLVNGETGVGKERLARAIHAESPRSRGAFVPVNCGAIPEALLESELFGHRAGAFTGATQSRRGWFELAHNGTIFLDEIGEMPSHLQVKLLRVLQSHEVFPVGSESPISVDVRVMAATNRDLEEEVREKRFRPDLFYRLAVVTLEIPPLRERREDIPVLAQRYVEYFQSRFATTVETLSEEAKQAMTEYSWPGNVRELINVIERALLLSPHEVLQLEDLPPSFQPVAAAEAPAAPSMDRAPSLALQDDWDCVPLKELKVAVIHQLERRYLESILRATGGRISETARRVGVNERNLFEKMRTHGLRKEDFKNES